MRLIEPPPTQYRKIDGYARDRMTSQGLDGGRHLSQGMLSSSRAEAAGRGMPSSAPLSSSGQPTDERFSFQGAARAPTARKFSPAPQLTTDIGGSGRLSDAGANGKQPTALNLAWD